MFTLILIFVALQPIPTIVYSDSFQDRYSEIVETRPQFEPGTPLESKIRNVRSPLEISIASVWRTDGAKVPYEDAEAHILIETKQGPHVYLRAKGFRSLNVSWIGERLLLIKRDIGHVAGIEEIFDLVDRKWILQQSVHYSWP